MAKSIPVKNIYYLLSYAWDFLGRGEEDFFSTDTFKEPGELLARIFDIALSILARRGFLKGYVESQEIIKGVRGKIDISLTLKSGALVNGELGCSFDEFSYDCHFNRIVKAAALLLLKDKGISEEAALNLKNHLVRLSEVESVSLSREMFNGLRFNSHDRHYTFIIELSRLVLESMAISNYTNEVRFESFLEKDIKMHRIFEKFIRRFYERRLESAFQVGAERFQWTLGESDALFGERVPELKTDVSIHTPTSTIVIDAKYYSEALTRQFGKFKYRRDHLSQLMDYLRAAKLRHSKPVHGILVYPTTNQTIYDRGEIEKFDITVATIDLSKDWSEIHQSLLDLITKTLQGKAPAA